MYGTKNQEPRTLTQIYLKRFISILVTASRGVAGVSLSFQWAFLDQRRTSNESS